MGARKPSELEMQRAVRYMLQGRKEGTEMTQTTEQQLMDELLEVIENFWLTDTSGAPGHEWYKEQIFNESRLYSKLGKEDARTVLGIWRRFKAVVAVAHKLRNARQMEKLKER